MLRVCASGMSGESRSAGKSGSGSDGPQSAGSQSGLANNSFARSVIIYPTGHQLKGQPVPPKDRRHSMYATPSWTDMQRAADFPL